MQLMKDFELWWAEQTAKLGNQPTAAAAPPQGVPGQGNHTKAAWRTPPITPNASAGTSRTSLASETGSHLGGDASARSSQASSRTSSVSELYDAGGD